MGDSDDEYDKRRRDKFRGERNDYDTRRPPPKGYADQQRGRGGERNSQPWERRPNKREYFRREDSANFERRGNFGGRSPPFKKTKKDWEGDQPWKGQDAGLTITGEKNMPTAPNAPVLMTFKDFMIQQEDDIDENEAVRRYQEYKVEFKKTQINDFFVLHKEEEWFEEKYHPVKSVERRNTVRKGLKTRLKLFVDFLEQGMLDELKLSITNNIEVLKLLDKAVVKLNGGTDEDMRVLDNPPPPKIVEDVEKPKTGDSPQDCISLVDDEKPDAKEYDYNADGNDDDDADPSEPLPPGIEPDDDVMQSSDQTKSEQKSSDGDNDDENKNEAASNQKPEVEYVYDRSHVKQPYSLFINTVPSCVTRADLEAVCKRYPGYLRIALSDPSPERRYARRAWVSFDHTVNIKDICWNLSNIRVKDMELNPIVNRDVSNRVRSVNGITCSPITMQLDLNFVIDLVKKLDEKHELYVKSTEGNGVSTVSSDPEAGENEDEAVESKEDDIVLPDDNPVLSRFPNNINEIVTGLALDNEEDDKKDYPLSINEEIAHFLDLLLLYLRLVHCVDYYNGTDYLHEDEMPMRCGIMHVRAAALEAGSKKDAHEWHTQNSTKLDHISKDDEVADDGEAEKLGKKNEEEEVENFIKANTQELAKDKWLCPLSGKKFRSPEFIRKHILMKHTEHVDNVKTEVKYFNNYIYDLKRPCFPDPRTTRGGGGNVTTPRALTGANASPVQSALRPSTLPAVTDNRAWRASPNQAVMYAAPSPHIPANNYPTTPQNQEMPGTYGRVNTYPPKAIRGSGQRGDYRKLIKYRDLDAPEETDFF